MMSLPHKNTTSIVILRTHWYTYLLSYIYYFFNLYILEAENVENNANCLTNVLEQRDDMYDFLAKADTNDFYINNNDALSEMLSDTSGHTSEMQDNLLMDPIKSGNNILFACFYI